MAPARQLRQAHWRPDLLSTDSIFAATREFQPLISQPQAAQLAAYVALLQRWNATYNLTAIDSAEQVLTHHLLDSLSVRPLLCELHPIAPANVLDVGSGGGLPGIPLAITLPTWRFTLVDAVGKKAAFLTQVVAELGLSNVTVRHGRVEAIRAHDFDVVVARAFAALPELIRLTRGALRPQGHWLAMRGAIAEADAANMPSGVVLERIVRLRVPRLEAERHAVIARLA